MKMFRLYQLTLAVVFSLAALPAGAAILTEDNSSPDNIPGLTGFQTTGADMVGMEVTATFGSGFSETLSWTATGTDSGGVSGSGWSLTQSGDTFGSFSWAFSFTDDLVRHDVSLLTGLTLNGIPGLTVFDRTEPSPGTDGSESGWDLETNLTNDALVAGEYSDPVGIGGKKPVGDIFHTLTIDFTGLSGDGVRSTDFTFVQDTDNDSRLTQVPLPGTLALLALGLLGLGAASRRRG